MSKVKLNKHETNEILAPLLVLLFDLFNGSVM